jgi:MrfA Zn-binding domain
VGKSRAKNIPPTGELRQSQVLTTFGPGSMVDLPNHAVLIGGLDHWQFAERKRVFEERLEGRLRELLSLDELTLYEPPVDNGDPTAPRSGITAFLFPAWFLAQVDKTYDAPDGRTYRTRPLIPWDRLVKGGYLDPDRKVVPVIPVRFVQACVKGHISDIDWYAYARETYDHDRAGQLWLDEGGAGNDFAEIYIRDERNNNHRRPLSLATVPGAKLLGNCSGRKPWLGPRVWEPCTEANRLLVRSASNAYFSQTLSVIAIPDTDAALKDAVDEVFEDFLQYCESIEDVTRERRKQRVMNALDGHSDKVVWADIQRRKGGASAETRSIKQAEIETLMASPDTVGEDVPGGDFYARARSLAGLPPEITGRVDRVVLVHRLREVVAQVGFTRFEPAMPDIDGELSLNVEPAPLARETTWLPAIENKGEGVFLSFSRKAIESWLRRPGVRARSEQLMAGFDAWVGRKGTDKATFPGLPYIMLHSLSHLLITAVALECGYSASAIRERVYAREYGYGILLYTGASGSEGTLGGLVDVGRDIESHLQRALELGRLCSNDPVCAQHDPANPHEERFLHGSACHGCLLIAETSCERRNEFLDRALVVPTVATPDTAFFGGEAG